VVPPPAVRPDRRLAPLPPVGRPVPRTRVTCSTRELEPVPIWRGGGGLRRRRPARRGYLNRPGTTAERFLPDPFAGRGEPGGRLYKTGDLARLQPAARSNSSAASIFRSRSAASGIELGEIEAALALHEAVRAVASRPPRSPPARLVAYVVARRGGRRSAELRRFLAERLPVYMIPRTSSPGRPSGRRTGKVDRPAPLPLPDPRSGGTRLRRAAHGRSKRKVADEGTPAPKGDGKPALPSSFGAGAGARDLLGSATSDASMDTTWGRRGNRNADGDTTGGRGDTKPPLVDTTKGRGDTRDPAGDTKKAGVDIRLQAVDTTGGVETLRNRL